jgi:hypothetical protein
MSFELAPEFVINTKPVVIGSFERPDALTQHSRGLGALSGTSIGVAFWLMGTPFKRYALEIMLTNHAMKYETKDDEGLIDVVDTSERRLTLMLRSPTRFGAFVFDFGIGIGIELAKQTRCIDNTVGFPATDQAFGDCSERDILIKLEDTTTQMPDRANVNTAEFNSVDIATRLSLGVAFD